MLAFFIILTIRILRTRKKYNFLFLLFKIIYQIIVIVCKPCVDAVGKIFVQDKILSRDPYHYFLHN